VLVMDLGVARLLDAATHLTGEGQLAGSLMYASPEQLRGAEPGPASDLYSLGVVLHELAVGENPFRREHPAAILEAHLAGPTPDLRRMRADVSPLLSEVVARLLARRPEKRYTSAAELLAVLSAVPPRTS